MAVFSLQICAGCGFSQFLLTQIGGSLWVQPMPPSPQALSHNPIAFQPPRFLHSLSPIRPVGLHRLSSAPYTSLPTSLQLLIPIQPPSSHVSHTFTAAHIASLSAYSLCPPTAPLVPSSARPQCLLPTSLISLSSACHQLVSQPALSVS
ncbi:hypothetical protein DPEC_G00118340 [Dallia pectoralis]|uniref:Uncharacterized protein n=1 Tax=Dallia pectoralis TaxID=75939 RepID=A0ACC2GUY5_DALPE|nr:hypothetical protein DPEC_G00118340 [Dallia pectoralis]